MIMKVKFLISIMLIFLSYSLVNAQDENVVYNDTLTQKLFQIKKDYSKRIFESTYYTIQIYFGDLKNADSILIDFQKNYEGIKSELIFETPNYKVRIGEYTETSISHLKN